MIAGLTIGLASLAIVVIDVLLFAVKGREATISRLLQHWGWDADPLIMVLLGLVVGGLLTHFFGFEP